MERLFSGRDLKRLIIPLIIEQFLQCLVGLADSIMVASISEAAVSSVSLVDTVMVLIINIFSALATGGAVVAGQYIGRKEKQNGCIATGQLVLFVTVFSVIIMGLGYGLRGFILHTVFGKIDAEVMQNSNTYLLIVFASIPFIALYNAGAAIFRSMGNSTISMQMAMIMNAINLGGNALLIYGLGMGVEGAAIPTLVSRMVSCIIIMWLLCNPKHTLHIPRPFSLKPDWAMLKKILYIGIPNGLENSMFQLGKIMVLSLVAGFGTASIAANAVGNNVAAFAILPGSSMGFAMLTVVAQCVGAQDYEQVKYYTKKLMQFVYVALLALNVLVVLLIPVIVRIYGLSPEASEYATRILIYHSICTVTIWPLSFTLPNALRAANDVRFTMVMAIISMWLFRVLFSYILGAWLGWGVFGVWVAMTIDWLFRGICFTTRFIRGKWQSKRL
nr:MATE family efflux transporter [bacterium]